MAEIAPAIEKITKIQLAVMKASGAAYRGQHAKMHGCLTATFKVRPDIPQNLRVGLFKAGNNFEAIIRFSNGSQADDREPDVHGMAVKLLNVPGRGVLGGETKSTEQDFILGDNPVFFIRDADDYLLFMQDFAKSASSGKSLGKFIAHLKENHPEDIPILLNYRNQIQGNPLTSTYWSQVPYAFGSEHEVACRYRSSPLDAAAVSSAPGTSNNYLRERLIDSLSAGHKEVVFDFCVQLKRGAGKSVINNPTVEWTEPFVSVATIHIPPQVFDIKSQDKLGEKLSFSPWHALPEHQPIGEVNEIRKAVYLASQDLRHAATR